MAVNVQFKCSGDCLNCRAVNDRKIQWQYCAAQFSYNALRTMQTMQDALTLMSGEIKELKDKLEAIQNSEADVFAPNADAIEIDEEKPGIPINAIAQAGSGA
jgi:hypothetical protein